MARRARISSRSRVSTPPTRSAGRSPGGYKGPGPPRRLGSKLRYRGEAISRTTAPVERRRSRELVLKMKSKVQDLSSPGGARPGSFAHPAVTRGFCPIFGATVINTVRRSSQALAASAWNLP